MEGELEGKRRPRRLPGSVLNTVQARVQAFHWAISVSDSLCPADSRRKVDNSSTFSSFKELSLLSQPLSFSCFSHRGDSIRHTIAVVTEGRYLVVLVDAVGLGKLEVLMVP